MTLSLHDCFVILPQLFVLVMACFTLLLALCFKKDSEIAYYVVQFTLVLTFFIVLFVFKKTGAGGVTYAFGHQVVFDVMATVLECSVCVMAFFSFYYARRYNTDRAIPHTEYMVLGLLSVLGMLVLITGHSLLTIYLGLELYALPTLAMISMQRGVFRTVEAGMKYFVISALASGILLYGFSFLFGLTQQLDVTALATALSSSALVPYTALKILALILVVAGIAFKLGAAPFQMWVPDVYEGAPTSTTLFIAAAPKVAAFAIVVRLLVVALPSLSMYWQPLLMVIAILSMLIGNLTAIMQTSVKRMLAYSSIAHMGYMLLGFVAGTSLGYSAALFYILSYGVMTLAGFGVLLLLSKAGMEFETLDDFSGLSERSPWIAFLMLITVFSMAGLPPLLGFIAKVHIFEALVLTHHVWLVVVALLLSVVGAYYYLRVIQHMYFKPSKQAEKIVIPHTESVAITLNGLAILAIGLFPNWLFIVSEQSFRVLG